MSTIEVGRVLTTRNSVNGVKVFHEYYNAGEKEIKYITFSYVPYNAVNDVVACTSTGKAEASGKLTGPIPAKHKSYISWENIWYNPTVTTAALTQIHVQYMDNTEELIDGKDVVFIEDEKSAYYREVTIPAAYQKKIKDASKELSGIYDTEDGAGSVLSKVFSEFKDDEEGLLKVFDDAQIARGSMGHLLGDYIEKEYSTKEEFLKRAVSFWKKGVAEQRTYYNISFSRSHPDFPQKYAEKIKKYEPEYVLPEDQSNFISRLVGKIVTIIENLLKK